MKTAAGIITLVCLMALVVLYRASAAAPFHFESAKDVPWGRVAILIVGMVIGILFGHLHAALSQVKGRVRIQEIVLSGISDGSLWASLFASPIVFSIVYTAASSQPDLVLATLLSFENGFFCQRILERRMAELNNNTTQANDRHRSQEGGLIADEGRTEGDPGG